MPKPTYILHRLSCIQVSKYQWVVKRFFASPKNEGLGSSVVVTSVFPDDSASAAGVRTRFLLERLGQHAHRSTWDDQKEEAVESGGSVFLTTTDKDWEQSPCGKRVRNEQAHQPWIPNLKVEHLPMNRSHAFDRFLSKHQDKGIDRIIFDRFYVEEAFAHSFSEASARSPNHKPALILDMQDMHSLRHGRQEVVRKMDGALQNEKWQHQHDPLKHVIPEVMTYVPTIDGDEKDSDRLLRELTSIHRCDLTLVCSPYEMDLLQRHYGIPKDKLCLASFFVDPSNIVQTTNNRIGGRKVLQDDGETKLIFCGGFRHDPNVDAVQVLLKHVWPKLRTMVPPSSYKKVSLHIHGAYCPDSILQFHSPQDGIFIHGFTPRLEDIFDNQSCRNILLAPLRFGAGIKGKILDAWMNGMPVVTTPIGSEGIIEVQKKEDNDFGGAVCSTVQDFCENVIELMTNSGGCYTKAQTRGFPLLQKEFDSERNWGVIQQELQSLQDGLTDRRRRDTVRAMLWHQSLRSTKYFSKWIEEKETKQTKEER
ncbi:MAG: hypothetical protein SGBAC_007253 [Bacillariaceae sp.]